MNQQTLLKVMAVLALFASGCTNPFYSEKHNTGNAASNAVQLLIGRVWIAAPDDAAYNLGQVVFYENWQMKSSQQGTGVWSLDTTSNNNDPQFLGAYTVNLAGKSYAGKLYEIKTAEEKEGDKRFTDWLPNIDLILKTTD